MTILPLFSLFAFILMIALLPILFGEVMAVSLGKLHLSPEMAVLLVIAIIIGGLVKIPAKRIVRQRAVLTHPLAIFGLGGLWPEMIRERRETIIAVNLGGCVIPTSLAVYELVHVEVCGPPSLPARRRRGQHRGMLFCRPTNESLPIVEDGVDLPIARRRPRCIAAEAHQGSQIAQLPVRRKRVLEERGAEWVDVADGRRRVGGFGHGRTATKSAWTRPRLSAGSAWVCRAGREFGSGTS
jgi:hypothetical protein